MADKKIKLIIFDLDGTLVESRFDIAQSTNFMRSQFSLPALEQKTVDSYIGSGLRELVRRAMSDPDTATLDKALGIFQSHYREHCLDKTFLYDGVREALELFHGLGRKLAVATNKKTDLSVKILAGLGVGALFGVVIGGDGKYRKKPDPEVLQVIMTQLGAAPGETAMVGDSSLDIQAGKNAGVAVTVGLSYGIGDAAGLKASGPDFLLGSFSDLKKIFS